MESSIKEEVDDKNTNTPSDRRNHAFSVETIEGEGIVVRCPFPKSTFSAFDPFLLLDELGSLDVEPDNAKGAPDHPHRGFETVTYVLQGRFEHNSQENAGKFDAGDVQWMTAGAGVVHSSEMPEAEFAQTGRQLHKVQMWVLPRHDKMIAAKNVPTVQTEDGVQVKVIAGEALGAKAVIEAPTPIVYLHLTLQPGATAQLVPKQYNAFADVLNGKGWFGADQQLANAGQMVLFAQDGEEVAIANSSTAETPLDVLLIAGIPLNEPVVRYGSFVMNTEAEIVPAIEDYRNGRMGSIDF